MSEIENASNSLASLEATLADAAAQLEQANPIAKAEYGVYVLDIAGRLLRCDGGIECLYRWAPTLDRAGIFHNSDWDKPATLITALVRNTLEQADQATATLECINQLRILAIANEVNWKPGFSSEQARHYLTQVLAHNVGRVFNLGKTEAQRGGPLGNVVDDLLQFVASHIGYEDILGSLCDEIWRLLGERPIQVEGAKSMITQIAISLAQSDQPLGDTRLGADRLISALFGPTQGCRDDPGLAVYRERLEAMDSQSLLQEAGGFARAMHDVGLVSDYHAGFLRWLLDSQREELIPECLGLSTTGLDSLRCYNELTLTLMREAIYPETAQCIYSLTMLLERGILFQPPLAPALWRQINMSLSATCEQQLAALFGPRQSPRVFLLAGTIAVLGQPLGVGQGNNPTCQSARAISMWSINAPDYLLHLIAQAAQFDRIIMTFEGQALDSAELPIALAPPIDNDPASTVLVPHLDRIYNEMGRRCANREEDFHCWVNPEFHGWWVGRAFAIAVDINTGKLKDYDRFVRHFFASYHPLYNGNQPVIHPQPAGLAITDSGGRFVGWHAITLLRVALDQNGEMRVYFYNPNNDSGQNWGGGVEVSTRHCGERFGESSLPFAQLASRLYIFHDEPLNLPRLDGIPEEAVKEVQTLALQSWASDRQPD